MDKNDYVNDYESYTKEYTSLSEKILLEFQNNIQEYLYNEIGIEYKYIKKYLKELRTYNYLEDNKEIIKSYFNENFPNKLYLSDVENNIKSKIEIMNNILMDTYTTYPNGISENIQILLAQRDKCKENIFNSFNSDEYKFESPILYEEYFISDMNIIKNNITKYNKIYNILNGYLNMNVNKSGFYELINKEKTIFKNKVIIIIVTVIIIIVLILLNTIDLLSGLTKDISNISIALFGSIFVIASSIYIYKSS